MDPNETLAALQRLALETEAPEPWADYFDALDGWLRSGGFLPDAWRIPHEEAHRAAIAGVIANEPTGGSVRERQAWRNGVHDLAAELVDGADADPEEVTG